MLPAAVSIEVVPDIIMTSLIMTKLCYFEESRLQGKQHVQSLVASSIKLLLLDYFDKSSFLISAEKALNRVLQLALPRKKKTNFTINC